MVRGQPSAQITRYERVVEMSFKSVLDHLPHTSPDHHDDGFWAALIAQEPVSTDVTEPAWLPTPPLPTPPAQSDSETAATTDPWVLAETYRQTDQILHLTVTDYNKGGLIVMWHDIQGFVPASQLLDLPQFHIEQQRIRALKGWLHRQLTLKIIEVNRKSSRLILSERASQVEATDRQELLQQLQTGDRIFGIVSNLTDFGAFIDLGGVEGLIHISELSWSRVTHPSQVVQPGQHLQALVLEIERENGRVALSRKRLKSNPWHNVESRYHPGQLVTGVVSNVVNFGAFVQLEEELEGLVHISELAEGAFLHPRNVVQKGETVQARVLLVDGANKRLSLSLRLPGNEMTPGY